MYTSEKNQISVSVDCVIFAMKAGQLLVLLSKRKVLSHDTEWSLPGDFIKTEENLVDAPGRILEDLAGIKDVYVEQVRTFGHTERYPNTRVITVSYYALVNPENYELLSNNDNVEETAWFNIKEIPTLVLDHQEILDKALGKLKRRIRTEPIGIKLLKKKFSLTQLQQIYEGILDTELDVRNFRKKVFKLDFLEKLNEKEQNVPHRRANLYSFDEEKYQELVNKGFYFDL